MNPNYKKPTTQLPEITVRPFNGNSNTVAFVDLKFYGAYVVTGLTIVYSQKTDSLFVSMPQRKTKEGEYKDTCFPITKEYREALVYAILAEYDKVKDDIPF